MPCCYLMALFCTALLGEEWNNSIGIGIDIGIAILLGIGIGIGIEIQKLKVLVLVLVLKNVGSKVLVLVLVLKKSGKVLIRNDRNYALFSQKMPTRKRMPFALAKVK